MSETMRSDNPSATAIRARNASRSFWRLMHQVPILAGLCHLVFMALFFSLGAPLMGWINVGSVAVFALSALCLRLRHNNTAMVLILAEIVLHAMLAVRVIGWDSGFHYYLLLVAPIVFVSRVGMRTKSLIVGVMFVSHLAMDLVMKGHPPLDVLSTHTLSGLRYFNIAVTFLMLSALSGQYYRLVTSAEKQLRELATTDPLTRLLNRRSWLEVAEYEVVQRQRHQAPLALVLADIDHFKAINDQFGHEVGDRVLQSVSDLLRAAVRQQDSVARWGGEEFMILMPQATLDTAGAVAERLREQVSTLSLAVDGAPPLRVSMTFGVSLHRPQESIDGPVRRADAALYLGKARGRNTVVLEAGATA